MQIGSPRIMQEQALQLVFLSSWEHCAVRILPVSSGGRGLTHGSFELMGYADHDPVVYLEQDIASLFLDSKAHTDSYRRLVKRLDNAALDEGQSRRWLADVASEFERAQEGCDA